MADFSRISRACGTPATPFMPIFGRNETLPIARGVEKGPALGAALRAAEEAWVKAGFRSIQRGWKRLRTINPLAEPKSPGREARGLIVKFRRSLAEMIRNTGANCAVVVLV